MLIALHRTVRSQRRRLALALGVAALATGVVATHGAFSGEHMGAGLAACVAVLDTAVGGVAIALGARRTPWMPRVARDRALTWPIAVSVRQPRIRAGPEALQVLRR